MSGKGRPTKVECAIGTLIAAMVLFVGNLSASSLHPILGWLQLVSEDDVELSLSVSPKSTQPGGVVHLEMLILNRRDLIANLEVIVLLPKNLSPNLQDLPGGTTYNLQKHALYWQPQIRAVGTSDETSIPLTANVAELRTPEQQINVIVNHSGISSHYLTDLWIGVPPDVSILLPKSSVSMGESVRLFANTVGPGPFSQRWELGDGRVVEAIDPEVVFFTLGVHSVTLQLENPVGTANSEVQLTVIPDPQALFFIEDSTVEVGSSVQFFNKSSGELPLSFTWFFGDGTQSTVVDPIHVFESPGIYRISLVIENEYGSSESNSDLSVGVAPIADISIETTTQAGVLFSGQAFSDETVNAIRWETGDGGTASGRSFSHVYWSTGDYLVTGIISNEFGDTVISKWVSVLPGVFHVHLPLISLDNTPVENLQPALTSDVDLVTDEKKVELLLLDLPTSLSNSERLLAYINEARRIHNLPVLSLVHELSLAAQGHTDDMALNNFISHQGSDGSSPALRVNLAGYPGGYAGEATAWGMQYAIEPVQFWLASPPHRAILLSPAATDVGVGYSQNYDAANVWYWTAEFASLNLPVIEAEPLPTETISILDSSIELLGPPRDSIFLLSPESELLFTWSWPLPLKDDERFAIYIKSDIRTYQIGVVRQNQTDSQYQFKITVADAPISPGLQEWRVSLENSDQGFTVFESPFRPISFLSSEDLG